MQSRKAWRNRNAGDGQAVLGLLEALRQGLGAELAGLFDDDRAALEEGTDGRAPGLNFWGSFGQQDCGPADWEAWYRALRTEGSLSTACRCGQTHRLFGFMLHQRWALLIVAPALLPAGGAAVMASSLRALADKLPPAMTPDERHQLELARAYDDPQPPHDPAGAPVWWIRRRPT
ncbi:MAG TPA: hypothetical protein VGP07_08655 [Polyangia bacterium]|jgi:hypothetical protein